MKKLKTLVKMSKYTTIFWSVTLSFSCFKTQPYKVILLNVYWLFYIIDIVCMTIIAIMGVRNKVIEQNFCMFLKLSRY